MRNRIVAIGLLAITLNACNTPTSLTTPETAPVKQTLTVADVVPVQKPKTATQKASRQKFLKESAKRFRSKELAAQYFVLQAQRTFNEQKLDSASYLFSRAWLMDSTNNDILWGYGKVYGEQKHYDKALYALYKALEKDKQNPELLNDVATSHLNRFYQTSNPEDLLQSKKLLQQAIQLNPAQPAAYYKMAVNSYYLKEYDQAWAYLHKSIKPKQPLADKAFVAALLEKQKDPKGVFKRGNVH